MVLMSKYKILVVEDDEDSRAILLDFLSSLGFRPLGVIDGLAAFEKIKLVIPDLVFLDIMMPRCSGFDLLEKLENENLKTQIVITTALNDLKTVQKAKEYKVTEFVAKPYQLDVIKEKISRTLLIDFLNNKTNSESLLYYLEEGAEGFEYLKISGELNIKNLNNLKQELPDIIGHFKLEEAKLMFDLSEINHGSYDDISVSLLLEICYSLGFQQLSDMIFIVTQYDMIEFFQKDKVGKHAKIVANKNDAIRELRS